MRIGRGTQKEAGLTCLEVLVIVFIIAILAAMLLPATGGWGRKSVSTKCLSNLKNIGNAMYMYLADNSDQLPHAGLRFRFQDVSGDLSWDDLLGDYFAFDRYPNHRFQDGVTNAESAGLYRAIQCPGDDLVRVRE